MTEVYAGEMIARVAPAPMVPFCVLRATSMHPVAHHRMAALNPEMTTAQTEARAYTAVESAAARVRIVPRE